MNFNVRLWFVTYFYPLQCCLVVHTISILCMFMNNNRKLEGGIAGRALTFCYHPDQEDLIENYNGYFFKKIYFSI